MRSLSRGERMAIALWVLLAVVAWNGIYDVLVTRGVKEYLFRWALHEGGRGPHAVRPPRPEGRTPRPSSRARVARPLA